jgi:hypothetical protein
MTFYGFFSEYVYKNVKSNWRIYKKYFWDPGCLTNYEIQQRKYFFVNEWLIQEKYKNLSSKQYSALQLKIWKLIVETCFKHDCYKCIEPTPFAKRTLMNPLFINDPKVEKVYIISRNICEEQSESKKQFIERYFNHPKIEYISVGHGKSKAEALMDANIQWDVFIDDEIPNIRDLAEKTEDLTGREFIIPEYGYNRNFPQELKFLIETRGGKITYFDQFIQEK